MAAKKRQSTKPAGEEPSPELSLAEIHALGLDPGSYEALPEDARRPVARALAAARVVLQEDPSQLAAQLWGRLGDLEQPALRTFLQAIAGAAHGVLLPRARSLPSPESPLLAELVGHTQAVRVLHWLPNGRLLSAGEDGSLRLWDVERGTARILKGHPGPINAIALSPDGASFATGSDDNTIALWSVKGPKRLGILRGHTSHVRDLGLCCDGTRLVSASDDGTLRVWELPGEHSRIVARYPQAITAMAVSPAASRVAVATMDNALRLVELDDGSERVLYDCTGNFVGTVMGAALGAANRSSLGHENFAKALLFSPDGETLYSVEESLIAWDVAAGAQRRRWRGHSWPIEALALAPDGARIATAAESVGLWELAGEGQPTQLAGHPEGAHSVVFAPNGESLVVGYEDGPIKRWDLSRPAARAGAPGHLRNVWSLALSPDQTTLASGGADRSVMLWEVETGRELARLEGFEEVFVHALAWSGDGRRLFASSGRDLLAWDVGSGTLLGARRWTGRPQLSARTLVCLPDERVLVAGYGSGLLCWSAEGEATFFPGRPKDRNTTALVLGPDRETVFHAAYHDDKELPGKVWRWDLGRGEIIEELETPGESVTRLALSDSGRFLIGGGSAGGVYVWDVDSMALRHQLEPHHYWITNLVALPGDRLLSGSSEGPVCEWDLPSGALRRRLSSLERLDGLCVSRDGTRLAARRKQTVSLFDLERDAALASFTAAGPVDHLRLTLDGRTVIAGGRSGTVDILRFVP